MCRLLRRFLLALAVLSVPAHTLAAPPDPCPAARFVIAPEDQTLLPGLPAIAELRFDPDGSVELGACGEAAATVRARRKRTVVRARWAECGDLRNLRLEARIPAPACSELRGRLRARGTRRKQFHAARRPGAPSALAVDVAGIQVLLSWVVDSFGVSRVRVLRRLNAPPVGPQDAEAATVFEGTGTSATEPVVGLLPDTTTEPRTYHYALFGCADDGTCEDATSRDTLTLTITQALRGGGYVLHWRHSAATVCADQTDLGPAATTSVPNWWKSCDADCATATARQLDTTGVADATSLGQILDQRGIAFSRVLSSEFCRNVRTAELMDLGPAVEQRPELTYFVYDEANRCANSYALIAEVPAAGTNTALIGHAAYPGSCPILGELQWSEAAVFRPDGAGGSTFIVRIPLGGWPSVP